MRSGKLFLILVLGLAAGLFFFFDLGQYLNLQTLKAQQASIEAYREARPVFAIALYFSIYVLVTALSLPGATLLTLAGGAIFGLLWGTIIISFASTAGATLAFLMSRFLLRDWVKARFGQPDDCADLVNKYGTYNIQPTSDTENLFPLIAPGLPEQWKRMAVGKKDVENLQ